MTSRQIEEYRALRATIRERSTARLWIVLTGLLAWALIVIATTAFIELPVLTLVPLLVLSLTFELIFSIHTAVERVGRYVQVFFEDDLDDRGWEHQAMEFGRRFPEAGTDPLFCAHLWTAIALNLVPAALVTAGAGPIEWTMVAAAHVLVAARIYRSRRRAAGQRALDLTRFTALKSDAKEFGTVAPASAPERS